MIKIGCRSLFFLCDKAELVLDAAPERFLEGLDVGPHVVACFAQEEYCRMHHYCDCLLKLDDGVDVGEPYRMEWGVVGDAVDVEHTVVDAHVVAHVCSLEKEVDVERVDACRAVAELAVEGLYDAVGNHWIYCIVAFGDVMNNVFYRVSTVQTPQSVRWFKPNRMFNNR